MNRKRILIARWTQPDLLGTMDCNTFTDEAVARTLRKAGHEVKLNLDYAPLDWAQFDVIVVEPRAPYAMTPAEQLYVVQQTLAFKGKLALLITDNYFQATAQCPTVGLEHVLSSAQIDDFRARQFDLALCVDTSVDGYVANFWANRKAKTKYASTEFWVRHMPEFVLPCPYVILGWKSFDLGETLHWPPAYAASYCGWPKPHRVARLSQLFDSSLLTATAGLSLDLPAHVNYPACSQKFADEMHANSLATVVISEPGQESHICIRLLDGLLNTGRLCLIDSVTVRLGQPDELSISTAGDIVQKVLGSDLYSLRFLQQKWALQLLKDHKPHLNNLKFI